MKQQAYTTSSLIWIFFAMLIGISSVGIFVEGMLPTHAKPVLAQEENSTALEIAQKETLPSSAFTASVIQARILATPTYYQEVPLLDSPDFRRGICPVSEQVEFPRYFAPMSTGFTVEEYIPSFLVEIQHEIPTKEKRIICMDETAALSLRSLVAAAKDEGHDIMVSSAYRSRDMQEYLFDRNQEQHTDQIHRRVAEPGYSEHQLGTAVDLTTPDIATASAAQSFADTDTYVWMQKHADEYGFVLSYPAGKEEETGYIYEPWHWRFVGVGNVELFERGGE